MGTFAPTSPRPKLGKTLGRPGYIQGQNKGTFRYIRVHSGTLAHKSPPQNVENPGAGVSTWGAFSATTHPFYNIKKAARQFAVRAGGLVEVGDRGGEEEEEEEDEGGRSHMHTGTAF